MKLYYKMTLKRFRDRPNCEEILREYKNWAIGKFDLIGTDDQVPSYLEHQLNILSTIEDEFKSYTQKIIYFKLSNIE